MDGPVRDRRLAAVQRSYTPARLSNDTLMSVYERVVQVRLFVDNALESPGAEAPDSESPVLVLTGGQYA